MAKLSQLKERNSKIEKGAWVKDLPNLQDFGIAVKVKGYGCTAHLRALSDEFADWTAEMRADRDLVDEAEGRLMAQNLLLDWKGVDDLPFNPENAKRVMTDPDLVIFRGGIDWATRTVARNGQETLEADAKN